MEAKRMGVAIAEMADNSDLPDAVIMKKCFGELKEGQVLERIPEDPLGAYRAENGRWIAYPWLLRTGLRYGFMADFQKKERLLLEACNG